MARQIYVNLPVKDIEATKAFFTKLGFTYNPQFTDHQSACMIIGENIFAMLISYPMFAKFTKKAIADAHASTEVITTISADSREAVDAMAEAAVAAGGKLYRDTEDHGWMYLRSFEDLDGHIWEVAYMNVAAMPKA